MNKKIIGVFCFLLIFLGIITHATKSITYTPIKTIGNTYLIENAEKESTRGWVPFDQISFEGASNWGLQTENIKMNKEIGVGSIMIRGKTSNWYCGKIATRLAKKGVDFGKYNALQMYIYGYGAQSGIIEIKLSDDDKGTGKFDPLFDDMFGYKLIVDWSGWKIVTIPFSEFKLDPKSQGNRKLNLSKKNGKGGLHHLELLFTASKKVGSVKYNLDQISLVKIKE